jgi:hypothetical protein
MNDSINVYNDPSSPYFCLSTTLVVLLLFTIFFLQDPGF